MKPDGNTRIYLCGVGGQGSLTASRLLGEAALSAGLPVTVSEVHGMSQRGGIVESMVLIGGAKSPLIGRGDADVLLAFEPLEALRALPYCGRKTAALVNSRPIMPFSVAMKQAEYPPPEEIRLRLRREVGRLICLDATGLAEQAGEARAVNAVLLGALARAGVTPIPAEAIRQVVIHSVPPKLMAINARAFELGSQAAAE